jgi:nicotinate dehydrogenase subunit A
MPIELDVNGRRQRVDVQADRSLLSVLRDELALTGTKYGCGEGQCGACTVLVDGRAVRACRTPVAQAAGKRVTTIEGLERDGRLHPLQQAFIDEHALQCGYCTAGMVVTAAALLEREPDVEEDGVRRALDGNLCRCGAHNRIVRAVLGARPCAR